ncbi:HIT family protein, partial [Aerococcus sp. UMB9870]
GHTLIVPKKHLKDIYDYDIKDSGAIFRRIPIVVQALQAALPDMQGVNILNNNGEVAYQSVFHSHIHLIPRYSRDGDDFK